MGRTRSLIFRGYAFVFLSILGLCSHKVFSSPLDFESWELIQLDSHKSCLKYDFKNEKWIRHCGWKEFDNLTKKEKTDLPALRLLNARVAHEFVLELKDLVLHQPKAGPDPLPTLPSLTLSRLPGSIELGLSAELEKKELEQAALEAMLENKTEEPMEAALFWLKPLMRKGHYLSRDAAKAYLFVLGDSLRFELARAFLQSNERLLTSDSKTRIEVLTKVSDWINRYKAVALRDWFYEKVEKLKSKIINGKRDIDLFYWTEGIKLKKPESPIAELATLKNLRNLWVAYPNSDESYRISEAVRAIGLQKKFKAPTEDGMDIDELMIRARAFKKRIQGNEALSTIRFVLQLPQSKRADRSKLWESLELHVKILRILDRREEILGVMDRYVRLGGYLNVSHRSQNLAQEIEWLIGVGKLHWSYGSREKALGVMERVITLNRKAGRNYSLSSAHYIKARISEQDDDKVGALFEINEALKQDLSRYFRSELLWRKYFLLLDQAHRIKRYDHLFAVLDDIKKVSYDQNDRTQLLFWRGKTYLFSDNKNEAIKAFEKIYDDDDFGFYGNVAGATLQSLGRQPRDWLIPAAKTEREPDWSDYFTSRGNPRSNDYQDLARVYYLSKIGDFDGARQYFSSLDSSLWKLVPRRRGLSEHKRRRLAQDAAWLRWRLNDPMGSLRAAEIVRSAMNQDLKPIDRRYLYPLAYWELIELESENQKVDPWIVVSLIRQESAFKVDAKSWANALGLMQMIPPTAQAEAQAMEIHGFVPEDLINNPDLAIKLGTHHIKGLQTDFSGSWICTLAAYNAGKPPVYGWIKDYDTEIPLSFVERISYLETRGYVKRIIRNYINYQRMYSKNARIDLGNLLRMPL